MLLHPFQGKISEQHPVTQRTMWDGRFGKLALTTALNNFRVRLEHLGGREYELWDRLNEGNGG